jgi:hypothetical protein
MLGLPERGSAQASWGDIHSKPPDNYGSEHELEIAQAKEKAFQAQPLAVRRRQRCDTFSEFTQYAVHDMQLGASKHKQRVLLFHGPTWESYPPAVHAAYEMILELIYQSPYLTPQQWGRLVLDSCYHEPGTPGQLPITAWGWE